MGSTRLAIAEATPARRAADACVPHLALTDPDFRVRSAAVRAAAARHWYATTPMGPAVLRHADCVALLRDRRLHQGTSDHLAAQGITDGPLAEMWREILLSVEGPDHARLRRLVSGAFTTGAVERLRPSMRAIINGLVDDFAPAGHCDFMGAFADRYPPQVMFDLLGFPPTIRDDFLAWGEEFAHLFSFSVAEHATAIEAALRGLYEVVDDDAAHRRPGEGLLARLVAATDGDDRLTAQELRSMVVILILAGQDTTRGQLGHAVVTFARHPEQWALLARRPELAPRAVEEVMRVNPVIPVVWRVAADDFTYRDLDVPAGTRLWLMVDAAHTEEAVYGPDGFDITAERASQLSFGGGVHYCLGAALARAEMVEALPVLADRLPGLELAGPGTFRPELSGVMGPISLPIRFRA